MLFCFWKKVKRDFMSHRTSYRRCCIIYVIGYKTYHTALVTPWAHFTEIHICILQRPPHIQRTIAKPENDVICPAAAAGSPSCCGKSSPVRIPYLWFPAYIIIWTFKNIADYKPLCYWYIKLVLTSNYSIKHKLYSFIYLFIYLF